ncbi:hypothetical protein LIER_23977 [Lithospermum erythrorhizon]|uniref:Uncharacterized protein n=1 Tax=Lithospermum erythrorhizon TaxID=34254 RepID=A0AAV3QZC7_LITER
MDNLPLCKLQGGGMHLVLHTRNPSNSSTRKNLPSTLHPPKSLTVPWLAPKELLFSNCHPPQEIQAASASMALVDSESSFYQHALELDGELASEWAKVDRLCQWLQELHPQVFAVEHLP